MKIYVVMQGEYSDKHILRIVPTMERASAIVGVQSVINPYDSCYILTYELDTEESTLYLLAEYYPADYAYGIEYMEVDKETLSLPPRFEDGQFLCTVACNKNREVMDKVVYDKYSIWQAMEEGI